MDRAELILNLRAFVDDTSASNRILYENVRALPGNQIDGININFRLRNRRVSSCTLYSASNAVVAGYTLDPSAGRIVFLVPPTAPFFADYSWYRLEDAELDTIINTAAAAGGFNADDVKANQLDYALKYCAAYYWLRATASSAEYYTLTVGGKQVSKSELFNHYHKMYESMLAQAEKAREDFYTQRGRRDLISDGVAAPISTDPYDMDGERSEWDE